MPPRSSLLDGQNIRSIVYKLLSSPGMRYNDLGPDYYEPRRDVR